MKKTLDLLYNEAKKAQLHSYSPYSKFCVGAAVLMENGKIYSGCNVENASFGGTICAERVAITKAVSEGFKQIKEILVLSPNSKKIAPCGICLQFISEFSTDQTMVHLCTQNNELTSYPFSELFPLQFSSNDL